MPTVVDDLVADGVGRRLHCDDGKEHSGRSEHDPSARRDGVMARGSLVLRLRTDPTVLAAG
jgi:hypothetical protein